MNTRTHVTNVMVILILTLIGMAPLSCTEEPVQPMDAMTLRVTNQIGGWAELTENGYFEFTDSLKMYDLINDAAVSYDSIGVRRGFQQWLEKDSTNTLVMLVCDFGTEQNARDMFAYKASLIPVTKKPLSVGTFDQAVAVAQSEFNGNTVYGHFGRFYFEMLFSGYEVTDAALTDAATFLTFFQAAVAE
jgi:hypothetical protein